MRNERYNERNEGFSGNRNRDARYPQQWGRNMDNSRRSYQRDQQPTQSFGYGDGYTDGPHYAGPYDSNYRDEREGQYEDRRYGRDFELRSGSFDEPAPGFRGEYGYSSPSSGRSFDRGGSRGYRGEYDGQYGRQYDGREESTWESMKDSVKSFFGKGPKGWRRSDDRIQDDVCEALSRHPAIDASEIEVTVSEGIVHLRGSVDSRSTKRLAEDAIDGVSGVDDVRNELQVAREGSSTAANVVSPLGKQSRVQ